MADLLVRLYDLPAPEPAPASLEIRRPLTAEHRIVIDWVERHFSRAWADECSAAFARQPVACFLAVESGQIVGFVAYEATARNFLGPLGVASAARGRGAGRALLLAALQAMRAEGYAYAIIGGVGPAEFFERTVGAIPIPGSTPGIYRGMLRPQG